MDVEIKATTAIYNQVMTTINFTIGYDVTATKPPIFYDRCPVPELVIYGLIGGLMCLLGFAGNTVSFLVLAKDKETPVASFLLQSLAFVDNFFLFTWFLHNSIEAWLRFFLVEEGRSLIWTYFIMYISQLEFVAQTATIWMTVLIAVSRYMAVCRPYQSVRWCSIAVMRRAVVGVALFSFFYNLVRFFEFYVEQGNGGNQTTWSYRRTNVGLSPVYLNVYTKYMYYVFSFGLPLLLLVILNTKLALAYRQVLQRRRQMVCRSSRTEQDPNITLVMIIVILIFIICQAPSRLFQMFWDYQFANCETLRYYIFHISNALEAFNSSTNFLVYCTFRHQFREILKLHVCRRPNDGNTFSTPNHLAEPLPETFFSFASSPTKNHEDEPEKGKLKDQENCIQETNI